MKKRFWFLLLSLLFTNLPILAVDYGDWYYISSSGYLIKIDLQAVKETGQVAAGTMPWDAVSCEGHIYFTDFATDQIYDYNPRVSNLKRIDFNKNSGFTREFEIYVPPVKQNKKPKLRLAFEKIRKPKKKAKTFDETKEPLLVAAHNKSRGLGNIACNRDYLVVVSTLKDRVEILQRHDLKPIASLVVGERPSNVAISPNGNSLAISSSALDQVYIVNLQSGFQKTGEFDVGEGPTEMLWSVDSNKLLVINRGTDNLSIISPSQQKAGIKSISFDGPVNTLAQGRNNNLVYVLSGNDKKLYLLDTESYEFTTKKIEEPLKFPSLIRLIDDSKILIGSESDGRFLILDKNTLKVDKKIQTNFLPRSMVKLQTSIVN